MTMVFIQIMTIVVIWEIPVVIREIPIMIREILVLAGELIAFAIFMIAHAIEFITVTGSIICKSHAHILSRTRCDQQSQRHYRQHQLNRVDLNSSTG